MKKLNYKTSMYAEMEPDIYDSHRPRWHCFVDGDMGDDWDDTIIFSANTFPPGTKVTVEIPCCPECGLDADYSEENQKCECGFNWKEWTEDKYQ